MKITTITDDSIFLSMMEKWRVKREDCLELKVTTSERDRKAEVSIPLTPLDNDALLKRIKNAVDITTEHLVKCLEAKK
jgi:hypothetical protein